MRFLAAVRPVGADGAVTSRTLKASTTRFDPLAAPFFWPVRTTLTVCVASLRPLTDQTVFLNSVFFSYRSRVLTRLPST